MFQSIGLTEWLIIALVVLFLIFGGKRVPEFFKGLGDSIKEFKKASKDSDKKSDKKNE